MGQPDPSLAARKAAAGHKPDPKSPEAMAEAKKAEADAKAKHEPAHK